MVREIARCGQIRWITVFVAAIARDPLRARKGRVDDRPVFRVEDEGEDAQVVLTMLALTKPGTDDDRGNGGLIQDPTRRDIRDGDTMLQGHRLRGSQDRL